MNGPLAFFLALFEHLRAHGFDSDGVRAFVRQWFDEHPA